MSEWTSQLALLLNGLTLTGIVGVIGKLFQIERRVSRIEGRLCVKEEE